MQIESNLDNKSNQLRQVGIEIEFIGISLERASEIVAEVFSGEVKKVNEYIINVENTPFGEFKIECDSTFIKARKYQQWLEKIGIDLEPDEIKKWDEKIVQGCNFLIPFEIVTPPIPISQIQKFDDLTKALSLEKKGEHHFKFSIAPCGLHINTEIVDMSVDSILPVTRSFAMKYETLVKEISVDRVRQLAPYIAPYPAPYVRLLTNESYRPDLDTFFRDYLKFNPTRNRALDLTPIIGEYDWSLFEEVSDTDIELSLIKPRPAFHYRLPNCHLEDSDWSFMTEWERWIDIENHTTRNVKSFSPTTRIETRATL